jgi:hypothetical protein
LGPNPIVRYNISVELKALKVRYGELVGEDVSGVEWRKVGFGTVEETVSLRKRKSGRRQPREDREKGPERQK